MCRWEEQRRRRASTDWLSFLRRCERQGTKCCVNSLNLCWFCKHEYWFCYNWISNSPHAIAHRRVGEMKKEQGPLDQPWPRLGPEVTTVTPNELAPLEHMDSPCLAPLEQAALHISSFHSARRCFQRFPPPTDHTWIKRETVDVLDMHFSSGYRNNCVGWAFALNCCAVFAGILPFNWKPSSCTCPKHILDKINVFWKTE